MSIRFCFDVISPYAYLANRRIHDLAAAHGRTVELVPILFAALLDAWGHKGPAEIPPKRIYTFKHVFRCAYEQGAPLLPPPAHPFNPLLALRLASLNSDPGTQRRIVDRLFDRTWALGLGVTDPVAVAADLDGMGLDGAALVDNANSAAIKARVRSQTDAARDRGVFGVPTVEVDGELFWGQDALHHVDAFLRGQDPVNPEHLAAWVDLPAQAVRKG